MEIPRSQHIIAVLWPSFLTACAATILLFTVFDPQQVLRGTALAELTRLGAYTVGFFLFWLLGAISSALTCYFQRARPRKD